MKKSLGFDPGIYIFRNVNLMEKWKEGKKETLGGKVRKKKGKAWENFSIFFQKKIPSNVHVFPLNFCKFD